MQKLEYSLPPISGILSFPSEEIMQYALQHNLLDSSGLPMHILLGRMIVYQMGSHIPQWVEFDMDTSLSITTAYHATRQDADYGKAWKHPDSEVNEFMQTHSDMEYAVRQAQKMGLNPKISAGIRNYIINPANRENWYFPHETLQNEGKINWTEAIPMLTSWLVAWAITRTHTRFDDLRTRRSAEIGKLELPFWKSRIDKGEEIKLSNAIVDIATKESKYHNESVIIEWIRSWEVTDSIIGKWILDGYEEWANNAISEYTNLTWIDDFYGFLERWIDTLWDSEPEKKSKIKTEFEKMLGRPLQEWEFIPYMEGIDLLFKRIRWLKVDSTRKVYREKIERSMRNISRVVENLGK